MLNFSNTMYLLWLVAIKFNFGVCKEKSMRCCPSLVLVLSWWKRGNRYVKPGWEGRVMGTKVGRGRGVNHEIS